MSTQQNTPVNISVQTPLSSNDDIVAELLLITHYGLNVYSKYHLDDNCEICLDSLLNQYTFQYSCDQKHAFHRNCLLTYVLNYGKISCPVCGKIPKRI